MRTARTPASWPWLVSVGFKGVQLLQVVEPELPSGTVLQIDPRSVSRLCAWDGTTTAFGVLQRYQGWRWALVLVRGTVLGEHLIARGQRGCPLDAKADLLHNGIMVLP